MPMRRQICYLVRGLRRRNCHRESNSSLFSTAFNLQSTQMSWAQSWADFSSPFGDEMYNTGQDADFNEEAPNVGVKRDSSSQGAATSLPTGSRRSKSSRSTDNPFVECVNSLSTLANSKLHIKGRRESKKEKFNMDMAAQVVESFESLDKGRKLTAIFQLQDNKWRKTFLSDSRDFQEYWLNSLEIAPQRGPDRK